MRPEIEWWLLAPLIAILAGCAGGPSRDLYGYEMDPVGVSDVLDAVSTGKSGIRTGYASPAPTPVNFDIINDFVQRGVASYYGKKFHGRKTSSGEAFDMNKLTAAHRTLPLDSYAQVINLENGKAVIVKINDRGPFVGGRVIDLSFAAARKLGFTQQGTVAVEVRAIPSDQPADFVQTASMTGMEPAMRSGKARAFD